MRAGRPVSLWAPVENGEGLNACARACFSKGIFIMALMINNNCIACDACLPVCPNQAIFDKRSAAEERGFHVGAAQGTDNSIYVITYERCTECVGHFEEPQCASVCPIGDCCVPDPNLPESRDMLLERARRIQPHIVIHEEKVWRGDRG